jgi:hypothetical protein
MWDSGTIFVEQYVSSREFNEFCKSIGGFEGSKRLDPPHSDQIEFGFLGEADNATTIVRIRDCDRIFYQENLDSYKEVISFLKEKPQTFIEVTITDKQPTKADYLNYYKLCLQVMKSWDAALADLDDGSLNYEGVENKIDFLENS